MLLTSLSCRRVVCGAAVWYMQLCDTVNLVQNPSFETGRLDPYWSTSGALAAVTFINPFSGEGAKPMHST